MVVGLEDALDIREIVQTRDSTRFTRDAMACVYVFLEDVVILPTDGHQWDVHKFQEQI